MQLDGVHVPHFFRVFQLNAYLLRTYIASIFTVNEDILKSIFVFRASMKLTFKMYFNFGFIGKNALLVKSYTNLKYAQVKFAYMELA